MQGENGVTYEAVITTADQHIHDQRKNKWFQVFSMRGTVCIGVMEVHARNEKEAISKRLEFLGLV